MSATDPIAQPRTATKTVIIAALALVVTFIAGFVVGAVVDRLVMRPHGPRRPPPMVARAMIERLDRHLDLDDTQRVKIEEILERHHERIDQLWGGVRPQVRQEVEAANREIEQVLTPEQRERFQKLKMRLGGRRHHDRKGPPGPPH